jgi:multicomponent Na+:H+ antiporter subunit G
MMLMLEILSGICLAIGSLLCIIGGIGLLRLPDFFSRIHASGLNDTLGTPLILLGLMLQIEPSLTTVKLFFIGLFILLSNPTAAHAMIRSALKHHPASPEYKPEPEPSKQ